MILGGGPNRIGQGIEFDYCCVQAAFALRDAGYETIMVNSNPETVSTDYDTSDHLFFEPLTTEDVLNIYERMRPEGAIVQFGGQTPLNLARGLEAAGARTVVAGVMQHIEEAGIHSGDSACVLPPHSLPAAVVDTIKEQARALAAGLNVRGLMNVQFAVQSVNRSPMVYVLEVNPRASRTVPFVSKATGVPLAKLATLLMVGKTLDELGVHEEPVPKHFSVKDSVFPFNKFPGVDIILGPEMRSTGEVMGIADTFPLAFAKSQLAANSALPLRGNIFISVTDRHKTEVLPIARTLTELGYRLISTRGTASALRQAGIAVQEIPKIQEGRPNLLDLLKNEQIVLVI